MTAAEKSIRRIRLIRWSATMITIVTVVGCAGWFYGKDVMAFSAFAGVVIGPLVAAIVGHFATSPKEDT